MPDTNLFEELEKVLTDFKEFLDDNVATIKPAIQVLALMIPQINELIDKLGDLMSQLKTEIQKLDVGNIPGLSEVSEFTGNITTFLDAAENLVPDLADTVSEVRGVAGVVSSLPSLDQVKTEIITLIDAIVAHLNNLKSS